jgi:hypothetical protein
LLRSLKIVRLLNPNLLLCDRCDLTRPRKAAFVVAPKRKRGRPRTVYPKVEPVASPTADEAEDGDEIEEEEA